MKTFPEDISQIETGFFPHSLAEIFFLFYPGMVLQPIPLYIPLEILV